MAVLNSRLVFLSIAGAGHLLPMVELAKRFLRRHPGRPESHFSVTILVPGPMTIPAVASYIESVAAAGLDIEFQELPPIGGFRDDANSAVAIKSAISHLLSSSVHVAALIVDLFATYAIDPAKEMGIPSYIYFTSAASFLALMLYLPTLQEKIPVEDEEIEGEMEVPGMSAPVPTWSMPGPFVSKKERETHAWFGDQCRRYFDTKGLIVNTFAELEPEALRAIAESKCSPGRPAPPPPVYPVGPILALEEAGGAKPRRHECLNWLDDQPASSVVFLCFGSRGCFQVAQVKEMAIGLERSGHRFLWAVRVASANTPPVPVDANLDEVLPEGFAERTRGRGLVWPSWAPQTEILGHPSVGGFVTHCGWNSTLESLWFGVPMLGWPLYAEQPFNAIVMAKDMGVALELKMDRKSGRGDQQSCFVGAEELERGVRRLMATEEEGEEEGRRVREKVKEMKEASRKAVEEGGSSFGYMKRLMKAFSQEEEEEEEKA